MSCWAEHLGIVEDVFTRPQTKECVDRVAEIAAKNWQDYLQVRQSSNLISKLLDLSYWRG
jgi:hypothetical protein